MFLVILFSAVVSGQEKPKKAVNAEKTSEKNVQKKIDDNPTQDNKTVSVGQVRERNVNTVKVPPSEFYVIDDKPVDKVTYLKSLKK